MTRLEGPVDPTIVLHLVGTAQDPPSLIPYEWTAEAISQNSMILAGPPDSVCPTEFVQFTAECFSRDPRIATVSWADSAVAHLASKRGRNRLAAPLDWQVEHALAQAPAGQCVLLNPRVFDLVGIPIGDGGTLSVASVDAWARRANHRGLRHVWWWSGMATERDLVFAPAPLDVQEAEDPSSALARLVDLHRAQFDAITIGVDASWLGDNETGAQVATVHWLDELAQRTDIAEIRLLDLPAGRLPHYAAGLASHPAIRVIPKGAATAGPPVDIFWRPNQPDHRALVTRDQRIGRRLVTTILDLIDYSNARYHDDEDAWAWSRNRTRVYMSRVDMVTGISQDVVDHLACEVPGLEPNRLRVTSLGVEHLADAQPSVVPYELRATWTNAGDSAFLLVLGNDFLHKNRDFAIRVWARVAQQRRIDLVLAGLHVQGSSSRSFEVVLLHNPYVHGSRAIRLEHVSPDAKTWLLANATVLLYPTSAEGFGFMPHEAASLGVPSVSTRFGPLKEFLPDVATVDSWSIDEYTERILQLIDDTDERRAQLSALEDIRDVNSWEHAAEQLAGAFRDALRLPPRMPAPGQSARSSDLEGPSAGDEAAVVRAMTESLSWRVTKPLRATAAQARRVKRRLR